MVAKLGRQQLGEQPVILVGVVALRAEHHLRVRRMRRKSLSSSLISFPVCRRPAVGYVEHA